ncbi:hypothetical protein Tco_0123779 [Tanacetum coccineum]
MAKQQTIKYAPQWTNMIVDNVIFQTNNVVGNFNYPPNVPAYKPIMKFLRNCPLYNAFTNYPSVVYQNFLREFWSTSVAFDPFPSTDKPKKRPLKEFLIKFSALNGQRPLTLDFHTFCSSTGLDYYNGKYVAHPAPKVVKKDLGKISINPSYLDKTLVLKNSFPVAWRILFTFVIQVLDGNYSSTKQVNSIQHLLAYSLITGTKVDIWEIFYSDLVTKILNKSRLKYVSYPRFISCALQMLLVTDIELMAHMIAVNNWKDLVSPPPLVAKPKKGSLILSLTLPKSQGPKASGALSKKRKQPKSKRPPTETKESSPKPTEGSEQSHSISSGTVPDSQDLERDIQLASTRFPSTLDEGTRQSKPLPEGTATHPKDSGGNKQPLDRDKNSTASNEGTAKTTSRPEGSLGDKDSGGNIPPADMEPIHTLVANFSGTAFLLFDDELDKDSDEEEVLPVGDDKEVITPLQKQDQPEPSHVQESAFDSSSLDLKKFDNILPLTERQLIKDQTDKLVEAFMSSLDRSSTTISDLYKGLNVITHLLKDISNAVKNDPATN